MTTWRASEALRRAVDAQQRTPQAARLRPGMRDGSQWHPPDLDQFRMAQHVLFGEVMNKEGGDQSSLVVRCVEPASSSDRCLVRMVARDEECHVAVAGDLSERRYVYVLSKFRAKKQRNAKHTALEPWDVLDLVFGFAALGGRGVLRLRD